MSAHNSKCFVYVGSLGPLNSPVSLYLWQEGTEKSRKWLLNEGRECPASGGRAHLQGAAVLHAGVSLEDTPRLGSSLLLVWF
jgi:hypothetical protein